LACLDRSASPAVHGCHRRRLAAVIVNAFIASAAGCLAAMFLVWRKYGKRDPSMAANGKIGDGKVFILDLEQCLRIRTGETGSAAIG